MCASTDKPNTHGAKLNHDYSQLTQQGGGRLLYSILSLNIRSKWRFVGVDYRRFYLATRITILIILAWLPPVCVQPEGREEAEGRNSAAEPRPLGCCSLPNQTSYLAPERHLLGESNMKG